MVKFSKSIVIFLFFSSFLGAFFYALHRTDSNGFRSLQFALYFLAIKIGLISPNVDLKFNQDQPNQQLVSSEQPLPVYNPYVSIFDDYRPSGLYMDNIQRTVPQHLEEIEDSRDLGKIDENKLRTRVGEAILRIQKQSNQE